MTATTKPEPPSLLAVVSRSTTSLTVSWSPSPSATVSGYGVYRDGVLMNSTSGTSYTFNALACGTSYRLSVDAYDALGTRSTQSAIDASTSSCPDAQAPSAPASLAVSSATGNSVSLTWASSTDNVGVTGYNLYRDSALIGNTTATSFTFTSLECGQTFALGVAAYDASGNRSPRASVTGSTTPCATPSDTQAPTPPAGLAVTAASATSISVSWTRSSDNVGVAGYGVYRNGSSIDSSSATSYTFSNLACGSGFTFAIDAYDAAGNRSARASVGGQTSACAAPADTQPPTTPGTLVVTSKTASSISVSWAAATDNVGVAGYGAYRNGAAVGSTQAASYTYPALACGSDFTLAVDAYDAAGNRSSRASIAASTSPCPDTLAPTTPAGFRVLTVTVDTVSVSWTASFDDTGVAGYGAYVNTALKGTTPTTGYTFSGLSCGRSYTFGVDAYDAAGNRSATTTVVAATLACPVPVDVQRPSVPQGLGFGAITAYECGACLECVE